MRTRHRHPSHEKTFDLLVKNDIQVYYGNPDVSATRPLTAAHTCLTSQYPIAARFLDRSTVTEGPSPPIAPVPLLTAANYAVLAESAITGGAGSNVITGNMGISPADAASITGFGLVLDGSGQFSTSSQVSGHVFAADYSAPTPATLTQAIIDMDAAYTNANARTPTSVNLNGGNLGGLILAPGVYKFTTAVTIPTSVTLDGGPTDVWIFQISGVLGVISPAHVILTGGALASNVFWAVAGATTLGVDCVFNGNILDGTNIAVLGGVTVNGRLLAQTAVTFVGSDIINQ
jgi:hypothetical protein